MPSPRHREQAILDSEKLDLLESSQATAVPLEDESAKGFASTSLVSDCRALTIRCPNNVLVVQSSY